MKHLHHRDDDLNNADASVMTHHTAKANFSKADFSGVNAPIGLFDSGVGGLSVYQHLRQALPHEHYIYYADTLNLPYGERSFEAIEQFTLAAAAWLVEAGCKLIIIACNSASTHALDSLRTLYPHIPIVGLVPALKPAVLSSQTKQVAVLATKATLEGKLLNQVITDYATPHQVMVTKWSDANLVPWVESGMPEDDPTAMKLVSTLHDMAQRGVDYVVLGCTHYPFFRPFLQRYIDDNQLAVTLIDSGEAIASRVQSLLMNFCLQIVNIPSSHNGVVNDKDKNKDKDKHKQNKHYRIEAHRGAPKLQFFSTKHDPKLPALVTSLTNDTTINFL